MKNKITVAGVTFGPDDVVSATITIDGREIFIGKRDDRKKPIGFAVPAAVTEPAADDDAGGST